MAGTKGKMWIYYVVLKRESGDTFTMRQTAKTESRAILTALQRAIQQNIADVIGATIKGDPLPADQYDRRAMLKEKKKQAGKFDINLSI